MARLTRWHPLWDWNSHPMLRVATARSAAANPNAYLPPMDIEEKDEQYEVTLSVPGFHQDQLKISLDDDILHIQGTLTDDTDRAEETGSRTYHLRERHMNRFARALRLPDGIDAERIQARYATGVLTLTIPKPVEVLPKQITITAR